MHQITLLPEARVSGHGYSSPFVCLFVIESAYLDLIAVSLSMDSLHTTSY